MLRHLLDEIFGTWAFHYKDFLRPSIDVYWNNVVRLRNLSELTVHEGFVKVKHKSLAAFDMIGLWA